MPARDSRAHNGNLLRTHLFFGAQPEGRDHEPDVETGPEPKTVRDKYGERRFHSVDHCPGAAPSKENEYGPASGSMPGRTNPHVWLHVASVLGIGSEAAPTASPGYGWTPGASNEPPRLPGSIRGVTAADSKSVADSDLNCCSTRGTRIDHNARFLGEKLIVAADVRRL